MKKPIIALDVDNTLFNWVDTIVPAIREMIFEASNITGLNFDHIVNSLQKENRKRHSVEHPYTLAETDIMKAYYQGASFKHIKDNLMPAFEAFNVVRQSGLRPYPGVVEFLSKACSEFSLVAYTESHVLGTSYRLQKLDLEKYFSKVYCGDIHADDEEKARFGRVLSGLDGGKYSLLDSTLRKPSPHVLGRISKDSESKIIVYVGDSLYKDVSMANYSQVRSAWAKYGTHHKQENSDFLIRISHWGPAEIEEFKAQSRRPPPIPDLILEHSLCELEELLLDYA
ncbi:HAD family hydrolase [Alkalicaulis satelles]|uniref:HAD family hydrolase n=1 Tax=Alkalicaulis satelles TaxID=2609175 RepID=A0A5M6ZLR2_9PROT|nr:HAD family hydrolase [Alkalicaulis satelles]KAA5804674.1 HAD family hydrolase [Alkalicaulis satelles]